MKIYKKATVYAFMEVDDDLSPEELDEKTSNFETDMRLDLDNLKDGGSSEYQYVCDVDDSDKDHFMKENPYLYEDLMADEKNYHLATIQRRELEKDDNENSHLKKAKETYLRCMTDSDFIKNFREKGGFINWYKAFDRMDKTCEVDAKAVIMLMRTGRGLEEAKSQIREISPVMALRDAPNHPSGQLGYYDDVDTALKKIEMQYKQQKSKGNAGQSR